MWETQMMNGNYVHFPSLVEHVPTSSDTYVAFLKLLRREFEERFTCIRDRKEELLLFSDPFELTGDDAPEAVQMELIKLQCSSALKATFKKVPLVELYRNHLPTEQFPALSSHAKIIASLFGSTKCKMRTQLTDDHLDDTLRLSTTSLQSDVGQLVAQLQHQASH